jgi:hypothetical protein
MPSATGRQRPLRKTTKAAPSAIKSRNAMPTKKQPVKKVAKKTAAAKKPNLV